MDIVATKYCLFSPTAKFYQFAEHGGPVDNVLYAELFPELDSRAWFVLTSAQKEYPTCAWNFFKITINLGPVDQDSAMKKIREAKRKEILNKLTEEERILLYS